MHTLCEENVYSCLPVSIKCIMPWFKIKHILLTEDAVSKLGFLAKKKL